MSTSRRRVSLQTTAIAVVFTAGVLCGRAQQAPAPAPGPTPVSEETTNFNYGNLLINTILQQNVTGTTVNVAANYSVISNQNDADGLQDLGGAASSPAVGRRLQQQQVDQENSINAVYTCDIKFGNAAPGSQTATVRPDTGSGSLLIREDDAFTVTFDPDPPPNSFTFNYGDVPADKTSVTATKYTQGFSFAADPTTSIDAQTAYLVARNGQKKRLGTLGLTFAPNTGKPSPGNVATVITNLIDTGAISLPLFTVALTSVPSSTAITAALIPGGRITFGALDSAEIGKDLACANLVNPTWTVALDQVLSEGPAASTPPLPFCVPGGTCRVLLDTGNVYTSIPDPAYTAINAWLGANLNDRLYGKTGPPVIDCSRIPTLLTGNYLVSFVIGGRVYTQDANTYINRYAANLIVKGDGTVRKTETCATIFNGPGGRYILGDNWMSVYPSVHIVPPGSVPTSAAPGSICFFGTVRVQAQCISPIVLEADLGSSCQAFISNTDLIAKISRLTAGATSGFSQTLSPPPVNGLYALKSGTTNFELQVANTANTDTCSSSVVVLDTPPTITCAATIKVAATANCRAQPTQSDLAASIVTASTQGSGGPLDFTITPSIAGGLPLGSQQVTVTATNCAGTLTCTSTVVVEDREALDPALGTCGALPAQGVLKKSVAASLSSAVLATYASTYAKTNGCPVSVGYSNLTCQNCLLGSPTVEECHSTATATTVSITGLQDARVKWTTTVSDKSALITFDCAVCVERDFPALPDKCPIPFDAATPCAVGKY